LRGMKSVETTEITSRNVKKGFVGNNETVILYGFVGKVEAAMIAEALVVKYHPEYFMHIGSCGAVNDRLNVGDIIVGQSYMEYDIYRKPHKELIYNGSDYLVNNLANYEKNFITGRICSGDIFVQDRELKEKIRADFDADCVDMDSAAIAKVCNENAIPFVALKIVVDKCENHVKEEFELNYKKFSAVPSIKLFEYLEKNKL
jgi:adenosylhomocysteine nucleosidase